MPLSVPYATRTDAPVARSMRISGAISIALNLCRLNNVSGAAPVYFARSADSPLAPTAQRIVSSSRRTAPILFSLFMAALHVDGFKEITVTQNIRVIRGRGNQKVPGLTVVVRSRTLSSQAIYRTGWRFPCPAPD